MSRIANKPPKPYDPDRELLRSFAVGCGVLFVLFLIGWVVIAAFWLAG